MAENAYLREYLKDADVVSELPAFAEAGERFLSHAASLRHSAATMKVHADGLRQFLRFAAAVGLERPRDATADHVDEYRVHLTEAGLSRATIDMRMGFVRKFFRRLEEEGIVFDSPAKDLVIPGRRSPVGRVPTVEEMEKLLAAPDLSTPWGLRDRAFLEVAYCCGLRIAEILGLDLRDVDFANRTVRVFGKGAKERALPLGERAVESLRDYLELARPSFLSAVPDAEALWLNRRGRRMTVGSVNATLNKLRDRAGIKRISVHAIRRACASHMLVNGAHPVQVRTLLGHASVRTLSRYVEVAAADVKRTHGRTAVGR